MPTVTVLPHSEICPDGASFEMTEGEVLCNKMLEHGIEIEHACEMSLACTTCHVLVKEGFDDLEESGEEEDDLLDKAWGLALDSRLSCQVRMKSSDLTVEIPRYTINHARE